MTYTYNVAHQAATADERRTLEIFLDHHRAAVRQKVRGVSEEDARRRLPDEKLDGLIAEYDAQCAISREIAARYQLDDTFLHRRGPLSVRWLYLHMLVESARHLCHLDILREIDGATGD